MCANYASKYSINKAINKYININKNGIPYKLTILHYMYQHF